MLTKGLTGVRSVVAEHPRRDRFCGEVVSSRRPILTVRSEIGPYRRPGPSPPTVAPSQRYIALYNFTENSFAYLINLGCDRMGLLFGGAGSSQLPYKFIVTHRMGEHRKIVFDGSLVSFFANSSGTVLNGDDIVTKFVSGTHG